MDTGTIPSSAKLSEMLHPKKQTKASKNPENPTDICLTEFQKCL